MSWLSIRRRLFSWCMCPGCWEPSVVLHPKSGKPFRGNLCSIHLWEKLSQIDD